MNNKSPFLEDMVPGSKRLYIIFGGIVARMGMPPFEFYRSSKILNESKIFFRDFSQSWYQSGLPGVATNIFELSDFIKKTILKSQANEVFFIGNSMGGYAAIMFAAILGRGTVIAFSPQTFISPFKLLIHRDFRWGKQILKTYRATMLRKHVYDLKPVLKKKANSLKIQIIFSKKDRLDYIHAKNLGGFENVTIQKYNVAGHDLVRLLRDNGELARILNPGDF